MVGDREESLGGALEMSVFPQDKCHEFSLVLSMTKGPGQVFYLCEPQFPSLSRGIAVAFCRCGKGCM